MAHIPHTHRHQEQIPRKNSIRIQDNPSAIICSISTKKPVWSNKEIQTPPRNRQGHRIGCICFLPDAPLGQPNPRCIRTKIPYPTLATTGLKISGPPHKTPEGHPIETSVPLLQ